MSSFRDLPTACWWLSSASFVNRMGAMVFPYLVLYFHRSLHFPLEMATTIAACWGLGSFLAGPLGGWAADRFDCVRVLAGSLFLAGVLMLAFPIIERPGALMLATALLALLADTARPSTLTAIARLGSERSRDAFALNYLAINLGMSIGPTLGGFLAEKNYSWLFYVDGFTSLAAGLLLWASGVRCKPQPLRLPLWDWAIGSRAWRLLLFLSLIFWVFSAFFSAVPVYMVEQLHRKERECGLLWLLNTLLIVALSMQVNRWTSGHSLSRLLGLSGAGLVVCYGLLWALPHLGGLVGALLILTLAEMLLFPAANAYLSAVVAPEKLGRAMGCNAMAVSLSFALSNPTVGYFLGREDAAGLWVFLAGVGLIGTLGFLGLPSPGKDNQTH